MKQCSARRLRAHEPPARTGGAPANDDTNGPADNDAVGLVAVANEGADHPIVLRVPR